MTYILIFGFAVTCSHLLRQPLGSHLQPLVTQASKLQHCTLSSSSKKCKVSSSLALQKLGIYSPKSLGIFHHFSARSSREKTGISSQNSIAEILVFWRTACGEIMIFSGLRTEVAVTCSHLAATCKRLRVAATLENPNAHLLRAQWVQLLIIFEFKFQSITQNDPQAQVGRAH